MLVEHTVLISWNSFPRLTSSREHSTSLSTKQERLRKSEGEGAGHKKSIAEGQSDVSIPVFSPHLRVLWHWVPPQVY